MKEGDSMYNYFVYKCVWLCVDVCLLDQQLFPDLNGVGNVSDPRHRTSEIRSKLQQRFGHQHLRHFSKIDEMLHSVRSTS
jgi:hypothetical protein